MNRFFSLMAAHFSGRFYKIFLPLLVMLAAAIIYYRQVILYNVNVPYSDDYGIALLFMNDFIDQGPWLSKLSALFNQHGEHRLFFPHLTVLLDYLLEGQVNFYTLGIVGNLGLAGILLVMYKAAGDIKDKILFFCPIVLLVLQLQHWELTPFPTAAIQGFYVNVFAFLSLYFLGRQGNRSTVAALITFFLATFCSGSGMLIFPSGVVILLVQKKYRILGLWILFFAVMVAGYFYQYVNDNPPRIIEMITQQPLDLMMRFLVAVGGFMNFAKAWEPQAWGFPAAVASGMVLSLLFLYFTYRKCYQLSPVLYGILVFLLVCCATLAVSRAAHYSPNELSTVSRYKIVSTCIVAISYLLALDLWKARIHAAWSLLFISLAIFYNKTSYDKNRDILRVHTDGTVESGWAIFHGGDYSHIRDWNPEQSAQTLKVAEEKHVYKIPDLRDEFIFRTPLSEGPVEPQYSWDTVLPADSSILFKYEFLASSDASQFAIRKGWALKKGVATRRNILVFRSEVRTYFFSTFINWRPDITASMNEKVTTDKINYDGCGFDVAIRRDQLEKGVYEVGVIVQSWDGSSFYIPANTKITI